MIVSLLVAMDRNRTIGRNNTLPWHLPADLAYFKRITMGHPIIMGRKTFESIGKPLPGRENIIVTRDTCYDAPGCKVIASVDDIKQMAEIPSNEELFIIGGAQIFHATFELADKLYITWIDEEFAGDTFFPSFDIGDWELVSKEKGVKDTKNPYDYYFLVYNKKLNIQR